MNDSDNPVPQILEGYKAAVHAKDVDAFVALYDADVRVFDMWGTWSHNGLPAWRTMAEGWFGSLGSERVVVSFDDVQTTLAPDLAVAHAFVTYQAVGADGAVLRALDNRITLTLRRRSGAWKIVHEHSSAPIDGDTAKARLKR